MIIIPLEPRTFKDIETYDINVVLDQGKVYEMAMLNIYAVDKLPEGIGSIMCDAVNPTITNQNQILGRFCKHSLLRNTEYYIIDTFNLRKLTLKLLGIPATSLAITLSIREKTNA